MNFLIMHPAFVAYAAAALIAAGCSSSGGGSAPVAPPVIASPVGPLDASMDPTAWEVGPSDYPGGNPSTGITLHPQLHPQGWSITIPQQGSAHYVTRHRGPMVGKTKISMRFTVELASGAQIVPVDLPQLTGMLTLYFDMEGLCWTAKPTCEAQRWFAPAEGRVRPLNGGEYVLEVPLTAQWTGVLTSTRDSNPSMFNATLASPGRVGFVLGGGNGVGHGVKATGPARITVTHFAVE